ncbi:mannose-1-phosphate guanylyltransferase/mannose-6-phosphate isomerase [Corticibacter populi]|uniref:mannose-1-phosphate guanylyltransferase/mannose-6-phosphate isomerase n=1 Tax=Corticibacter populi TaxID=1550736 RepID=UPI001A925CC9|nr:mannose-1-phosphate guanylyltransferase/mannose-6-phosphate isomerase [Corticibacter populi]
MLIPCIIAGGSGTRLWPVSRQARPKPFMTLPDGQSLLQKTLLRAAALTGVEQVLVVTGKDLYFSTQDEFRQLPVAARLQFDYLLEPQGRNTAPAIAAAALRVQQLHGDEALLLVLPADHLIDDQPAFAAAVQQACEAAQQDWLVTFGIQPQYAEIGYGYIETGDALDGEAAARHVVRFTEKPDEATAQQYLLDGRHLWNAGMFCFRAAAVLAELAEHAPDVLEAAGQSLAQAPCMQGAGSSHVELAPAAFAQAPDISIDYALMERSQRVVVVPCDPGWNDIGSWTSMRELYPRDADGNQSVGETVLIDVEDCFIDAPERLVGAVGITDLIVVDTPDALLIADARRSQDVKRITETLKQRQHDAYRLHRTVNRPWGTYSVIEEGPRFKIKRIVVKPGASLSLQMHHHRSEHWIVVSGMARVVNGEREFLLDTNESTFIKAGQHHRLSNPGVIDLVMIEVQSGEYLGEDDIVRFDDVYGRVAPATSSDAPSP